MSSAHVVVAAWALVVAPAVAMSAPEAPRAVPSHVATSPTPTPVVAPVLSLACGPGFLSPGPVDEWAAPEAIATETSPPDYYAIDLVPTGRVPGTRLATGFAYSTFAPSPFGVSLAPSGEYVHNLEIVIERLRPPASGAYVAWVTNTEITEVVRLGALDENMRVSGQARWNKFLVVITREPTSEPASMWEGPVILRGMSRSGRMHTMAGHGPFEAEPCAKYGFR